MGWLDALASKLGRTDQPSVARQMAAAGIAADAGDYEAALTIWGPLAHAGVGRAQANIGQCFFYGLGVERDAALALRWLKLAVQNGDPVGQRSLARLYLNGDDIEQDSAHAAQLYRLAAEAGDGLAQDALSRMLVEGQAIATDVEARRWAEAAAAQGIAAAMTRLGMMFHNARGAPRDARVAAEWWAKAAELGDPDGQAMLGAAFYLGAGVPRDSVAAYALLLRADNGGSTLVRPYIDAVRSTLSRAELDEAELRANSPLPGAAA